MKVLICVFAIGKPDYYSISERLIGQYCLRHGIEVKFVTEEPNNPKKAHPSWLKLIVHRLFERDFILCWDLDLIPVLAAPNILGHLDFNKLNMCYDFGLLKDGKGSRFRHFKYNGGLIGIPSSLSGFTESVYDEYAPGDYPSYEQYYLNDEIEYGRIPVNVLDIRWNTFFQEGITDKSKAYAVHFTGYVPSGQKVQYIERFGV